MDTIILGIESSCDDTSAAVIKNGVLLSNVVSSQAVHEAYGGVVPELASRAHQQNIVPVVHEALKRAGVTKEQLSAVAFTRGPGLMGSLLVGVSFAKGFARSLNIPMIDVNHLQAHVLAHFIKESEEDNNQPKFPFLCLLVSGGNSQIILVKAYNDMEVLGQTIDDAAGEAIDKCSKVMGLGYPGGPIIDKLARQGNPKAFTFSKPHIPDYNYSFSGLKTSFLYSLRDWLKEDPDFIEHHKNEKQDLHCLIAALYSTFISSPRKRICLQPFSPLKQLLLSSLISHQILINKLFHLFFIPVKTIRCRQNRILLAICIIHFLHKHFLNSKKCLLLRHFLKKSTNSFLHIREHLKQCLRRLQRTFQNLIVLFLRRVVCKQMAVYRQQTLTLHTAFFII